MVGFLGWEFSSMLRTAVLRTAARASGTLLRSGGAAHCHLEQGRPVDRDIITAVHVAHTSALAYPLTSRSNRWPSYPRIVVCPNLIPHARPHSWCCTTPPIKEHGMNKDQVKGSAEQAKGKIQEVAGRAVGNPNLETKGDLNQVAGKVQKTVGDAKEQIKKTSR